jgi:hypothetical protein
MIKKYTVFSILFFTQLIYGLTNDIEKNIDKLLNIKYSFILENGININRFSSGSIISPIPENLYYTFKTTQGIRLKQNNILGIGVGIDLNSGKNYNKKTTNNKILLPIFVEYRREFLDKKIKPFVGSRIGYVHYIYKEKFTDTKLSLGGFMLEIPFGFVGYIKEKIGLGITAHYRFQYMFKDYGGQLQYYQGSQDIVKFPSKKHDEKNHIFGVSFNITY